MPGGEILLFYLRFAAGVPGRAAHDRSSFTVSTIALLAYVCGAD